MFLNRNALLDEAIGGWQISGTIVLSTGNPFTVYSTQNTYALAGSAFPNWTKGQSSTPHDRSIKNWYNAGAFSQPANGTFGNVKRNSLYGPGLNEVNLSGGKTFSVPGRESIKIQIRGDAQNAFNHPSFANPGTQLGGSNGVGTPYTNATAISSLTVYGRNIQLGARVTF